MRIKVYCRSGLCADNTYLEAMFLIMSAWKDNILTLTYVCDNCGNSVEIEQVVDEIQTRG